MPPKQLRSPEGEETSDEFVEAELEMLAMGARNIPQGTALGECGATRALGLFAFNMKVVRQDEQRSSGIMMVRRSDAWAPLVVLRQGGTV